MRSKVLDRRWRRLSILAIFIAGAPVLAQSVVISQIYGGGGNEGATLRNDFIELFNRGAAGVDITNWSVQYAAAKGSNWMVSTLSGLILPGQYYLVQEEQGKSGSVRPPAPDATGGINLSATSGKVALVNNSAALSGVAPAGPNILDVVGYGAADFSEGAAAPELSNTTAVIRRSSGCTDTANNYADFTTAAPSPRNTSSPLHPCVMGTLPSISAVTNAASFLAGPVSPGELVTIFGSNIGPVQAAGLELTPDGSHVTDSIANTRVLFDGVAAPLIYVSGNQLTAVVPFLMVGHSTTSLQVEMGGQRSGAVILPVASTSPGIFSANQSGQGPAAVLNQDLSANTPLNPARAGSFISIYGTGGGQTNPPGEDGKITGSLVDMLNAPAHAQIGGAEAEVSYAGTASGLISGVLQFNVRVPGTLPTADGETLVLHLGDAASQPGITVAVRNPDSTAACGEPCGEERWSVKNLTDADVAKINFTPAATTVGALLSLDAPPHLPEDQRIAPTELQALQVTARLVGFKLEDDMDFHVVIADPADSSRTMIVEIPSPDCGSACRSGHSPEFIAARNALVQRFGAAKSIFKNLPSTLVSITGIGFFDFIHGQTGVAANGIELHPVLHIKFLE